MRRDVGRHPHRDPRRAVDQQVREARRQDRRLLGRFVVVGGEVDRVRVDVTQQLRRQPGESRLGVVADEAVGQERVVFALHSKRVDGLDARPLDRLDLCIEVIAGDQWLDHPANLRRLDPLHDRRSTLLPAFDSIDVVTAQPVPLGRAGPAVSADVVGDVRNVIVAERPTRLRDARKIALQFVVLGANETDVPREDACIAPVADHNLELTLLVATDPARPLRSQAAAAARLARAARCRSSKTPESSCGAAGKTSHLP